MKIGSLFSGAGGLDLAAEEVFAARTIWHCEVNPSASKVLAARWPGVPNYGDVTSINWDVLPRPDILTGGFPCQDISVAGRQAGIKDGTRSGLWSYMAAAVAALRPAVVIIENVRNLLNAQAHRTLGDGAADVDGSTGGPVLRAAGAVLGDLADIGYDAQWCVLPASAIGAPHRRDRVFILAFPAGRRLELDIAPPLLLPPVAGAIFPTPTVIPATSRGGDRKDERLLKGLPLLPTPQARDWHAGQETADERRAQAHSVQLPEILNQLLLLPTPRSRDYHAGEPDRWGRCNNKSGLDLPSVVEYPDNYNWAQYDRGAALEHIIGRAAPPTHEANSKGRPRLSAPFPEWMMGWEPGWVTEMGLSRQAQLECIGNGVVPQQASAAIRLLLQVGDAQ